MFVCFNFLLTLTNHIIYMNTNHDVTDLNTDNEKSTNYTLKQRGGFLRATYNRQVLANIPKFGDNLMRNILDMTEEERNAIKAAEIRKAYEDLKSQANVLVRLLNAIQEESPIV